jgi:hypothetical protein
MPVFDMLQLPRNVAELFGTDTQRSKERESERDGERETVSAAGGRGRAD